MTIETVSNIQALVRDGFSDWAVLGDVKVIEYADFLLFNYTAKAQYIGRWNAFERMSRGLIVNRVTGEIVARPFDKFFNWNERGMKTDAPIVSVAEKYDGSLGILWRDGNKYRIATRGSFDSEQAKWATRWLNAAYTPEQLDRWNEDYTYLFEIIYSGNRIVIDYADMQGLVLLAMRHRHTGEYVDHVAVLEFATAWQLYSPRNFIDLLSPDDLTNHCTALPANEEGYVATFADGSIFKFKGTAYCELHKLISGISFKNTLDAVANGTVDHVREHVPDEFLADFNRWVSEIEHTVKHITDATEDVYANAPKDNRGAYAAYVLQTAPDLAPYAFARLDNKPLAPVIYKQAFRSITV